MASLRHWLEGRAIRSFRRNYPRTTFAYVVLLSVLVLLANLNTLDKLLSHHASKRSLEKMVDLRFSEHRGGNHLAASSKFSSLHRCWPSRGTVPSVMDIGIKIVANNRLQPLERLLRSLVDAHYEDACVPIEFYLEANQSAKILRLVHNLKWQYGPKQVHLRHTKGGFINAVLESWYPVSEEEYYIILEDDLEVSPFFYMWAARALFAYKSNNLTENHLVGISLYTPRVGQLNWSRPQYRFFKNHSTVDSPGFGALRFQLPCSWGTLYFPKFWAELRVYAAARHASGNVHDKFVIPGSHSTGWSVSWKKFAIELFWSKGYYLIYPNLFNESSFSTYHLKLNIRSGHSTMKDLPQDYTVPLVYSKTMAEKALAWTSSSSLSILPLLDVFGNPVWSWSEVWRKVEVGGVLQDTEQTKACTSKMLTAPCLSYNKDINQLLSTSDKFTIVISFFWTAERSRLLDSFIRMYATFPLVDKIFVVWHDHRIECPNTAIIGGVLIYFACQRCDSLNNRFLLDTRITTEALLIVDDDIQVHYNDLENLFHSWQLNKDRIVGFFPRWFQPLNDSTGQYGWSAGMVEHREGYSFILTKAMMVHAKYIFEYRCGIGAQIHKQVDAYTNGEDLAFNIMVTKLMGRVGALFVKPEWPLVDYGTYSNEGIHMRSKQHLQRRDEIIQSALSMLDISAWELCCKDQMLVWEKASGKPLLKKMGHLDIQPYVFNPCRHATDFSICKAFIHFSSLRPINEMNISHLTI